MPEPSPPTDLVAGWLESWRWASALGWEFLETLWKLRPPEGLRTRLLAEARHTTAEYLKSPAFLELMRANLSAMTFSQRLMSPFRIH